MLNFRLEFYSFLFDKPRLNLIFSDFLFIEEHMNNWIFLIQVFNVH
jgi:hypothetical protein